MDKKNHAITLIADKLQLQEVSSQHSNQLKFEALVRYLDNLIQSNFNKLLSILYRIDVSEEKIKKSLAKNQNKGSISAGRIIATLLIEREYEKIILRARYKNR